MTGQRIISKTRRQRNIRNYLRRKRKLIKKKYDDACAKRVDSQGVRIKMDIKDRVDYKALVEGNNSVMRLTVDKLLKFKKVLRSFVRRVPFDGMPANNPCYEAIKGACKESKEFKKYVTWNKTKGMWNWKLKELDIKGYARCTQLITRAWFIKDMMKYGKPIESRTASHLCHNKKCIKSTHIVFEPLSWNMNRNMCIASQCIHWPKCLRNGPSVKKDYNTVALLPL